MNNKEDILILTEAGDTIGFGHFTRCMALQNLLKSKGTDCKIALNLKGSYDLTFDGFILDWIKDEEAIRQMVNKKTKKVIIDSYLATQQEFITFKSSFEKMFVIDDYNRICYNTDVLINPNIFGSNLNYSNQKRAKIFSGKDFVILREVFRNRKISTLKEKVEHIVITVGGSDYRKILPKLISVVEESSPKIKISVIVGNADLKKQLNEMFKNAKILGLLNAQEMYGHFDTADIVISACGQTLHELASMGKPTIGICLDIDQQPNQDFYYRIGFLKEKIRYDELELIKCQISILKDLEERKRICDIGSNAFKKNGVENICNVILSA